MAGVKDIRAAVELCAAGAPAQHRGTVLFLDEVHRFKSRQDSFFHTSMTVLTLIPTPRIRRRSTTLCSRARVTCSNRWTGPISNASWRPRSRIASGLGACNWNSSQR
jgi:hypothetical protein